MRPIFWPSTLTVHAIAEPLKRRSRRRKIRAPPSRELITAIRLLGAGVLRESLEGSVAGQTPPLNACPTASIWLLFPGFGVRQIRIETTLLGFIAPTAGAIGSRRQARGASACRG